jgi:hypothetical protein
MLVLLLVVGLSLPPACGRIRAPDDSCIRLAQTVKCTPRDVRIALAADESAAGVDALNDVDALGLHISDRSGSPAALANVATATEVRRAETFFQGLALDGAKRGGANSEAYARWVTVACLSPPFQVSVHIEQ